MSENYKSDSDEERQLSRYFSALYSPAPVNSFVNYPFDCQPQLVGVQLPDMMARRNAWEISPGDLVASARNHKLFIGTSTDDYGEWAKSPYLFV